MRALPDGTVLRTASAKRLHPNNLPAPEFDDEELGLYRDLALPVYVTRGCYWGKCTFCDYVKLYTPGQPRVLARDAEKVVEDVKLLQSKHRVFRVRLITEAIPPKWCREFSRAIIANRVRASFWTYLKNEPKEVLTQELFELMKRAGIDDVTCGVESISDRVLAVIVKGTTVEDITDNFEMMRRADIRAVLRYPGRLKVGELNILRMGPESCRVATYSGSDPLDLPPELMDTLTYFEGRTTDQALRAIEVGERLRIDQALIRRLVDFRILVPDEQRPRPSDA